MGDMELETHNRKLELDMELETLVSLESKIKRKIRLFNIKLLVIHKTLSGKKKIIKLCLIP